MSSSGIAQRSHSCDTPIWVERVFLSRSSSGVHVSNWTQVTYWGAFQLQPAFSMCHLTKCQITLFRGERTQMGRTLPAIPCSMMAGLSSIRTVQYRDLPCRLEYYFSREKDSNLPEVFSRNLGRSPTQPRRASTYHTS